jgi:hypothetical protein
MSGASIEETLELWAASLREVKARMRRLFTRERVAASTGLFLDGLLGEERRKTGWMRAEAAGDPGPWRRQAILGRGRRDADALREIVREYVVEHLTDEGAVPVIDETGFLKQGKAACGAPARAVCLASAPPAGSIPGAPSPRPPGPRPKSRARLIPPPGIAYRPGPEPKANGCSTGPIWNSPIAKRPNTTRPCPVFGPRAC